MYVPRGKITSPDAILYLLGLRFPDLKAALDTLNSMPPRVSQAPPPISPITRRGVTPLLRNGAAVRETAKVVSRATNEEAAQRRAIADATLRQAEVLRDALGDGDLAATALTDRGEDIAVPETVWRSVDALAVLQRGWLDLVPPDGSDPMSARLLLVDAEFYRWAEPPSAQAHLAPEAIDTWILAAARTHLRERGEKPFKKNLVDACISATGCSSRAATSAFTKLPDELKRTPTERRKPGKRASVGGAEGSQ